MNRSIQKANTRKKLLQTAIKLFKLNGIKAVKTGEIAQNAGVSTGTFYVHFKSKEEIISAIYYDSFNDFMQERLKTLNVNAESLTQLLIKIGNFEFNFVDQVGREVTTNAFSANLMTNYEHPGHHLESRTFPAKIKTIIAKKDARNPEETLVEFETLLRGIMLTWCFNQEPRSISAFGDQFLHKYVPTLTNQ